ncbi:MAG: Gfo/Idh/MocA family oxidoreductase, partial [Anaerolineae bacterium]
MVYRVGIIGTGAFAHTHAQALMTLRDRVEIVAAANIDSAQGEAFCRQYDIPALYPSAEALLESAHPDIVHLCTPPITHAPLAKLALKAGAHVLSEKPLCGSLAEFESLEQVQAESGRSLSTVFQWRFGAAAQHVKRLIAAGEF